MRAVLLVALVACTEGEPREVQSNIGQACVRPSDPLAGAGVGPVVTVGGFGCSTCDRDQRASCKVARDGDILRVTSEASWIASGGECVLEACGLHASCGIGALEDGTYTLMFGGKSTTFAAPSDLADFDGAPCVTQY